MNRVGVYCTSQIPGSSGGGNALSLLKVGGGGAAYVSLPMRVAIASEPISLSIDIISH